MYAARMLWQCVLWLQGVVRCREGVAQELTAYLCPALDVDGHDWGSLWRQHQFRTPWPLANGKPEFVKPYPHRDFHELFWEPLSNR